MRQCVGAPAAGLSHTRVPDRTNSRPGCPCPRPERRLAAGLTSMRKCSGPTWRTNHSNQAQTDCRRPLDKADRKPPLRIAASTPHQSQAGSKPTLQRTTLHRSCPPTTRASKAGRRPATWSEPLDDAARAAGFSALASARLLPASCRASSQLVAMRLCDAMPVAVAVNGKLFSMIESDRERRGLLESYLDRGLGSCWLRQHAIARLVEESLRFWHGARYRLEAWTVMPNRTSWSESWQTLSLNL